MKTQSKSKNQLSIKKLLFAVIGLAVAINFSACEKDPFATPDKNSIGNANTLPSNYSNQGTITVHNKQLEICARDFATIDGDKIDIVINGTTYLSNYTVSGTNKCLNVNLSAGNNWIGIIARSEGSISPCTPGITIDDGYTSQDFQIQSTVSGVNGAYIINVVN